MGERDRQRQIGTSPLLTVDGLVAGYSEPVAGPVSFVVKTGDVVGLAGPNGAGKTTILSAIVGTARVHAGSLMRAPGLKLAVQSQRPARLPEMPLTGREFLHITGADDQALPEVIQPLLEERLDRLSGGQFQLLHVWACLGCNADLVLLDEPTNNMDPQATIILRDLLRAGRDARRGVIVVNHDHDWLEAACTRVVEIGA